MLLIKNPAGANEVVRTIVDGAAPKVAVIALNDAIADGRDVSWIWDVDFEPLVDGLDTLVATGSRASELALRFAYGGLDRERIEVVPSLEAALDRGLELTPPAASSRSSPRTPRCSRCGKSSPRAGTSPTTGRAPHEDHASGISIRTT